MQLVHMTDFRKAVVDDICAVHERSYVLGLEKLAAHGKDEIVDGAPTYITGTSFNDALQVLPPNTFFVPSCPPGAGQNTFFVPFCNQAQALSLQAW